MILDIERKKKDIYKYISKKERNLVIVLYN